MIELHLARYRFHWRVKTSLLLPPYAASTLRGVLGHALRRQVCLTRARSCKGCPLLTGCAYPAVFEPQSLPREPGGIPALSAYAIETPFTEEPTGRLYPPGAAYSFDMVLMGQACLSELELLIAAWRAAFASGVGPQQGTAVLEAVEHLPPQGEPVPVCSEQQPGLQQHHPRVRAPSFRGARDVQLELQTPLRIQQRGQLIDARNMTAAILLRHLIRRVSFHACAQQPEAFEYEEIFQLNRLADQVRTGASELNWVDWERFSSRQQRKMKLGGLIGQWQLLQVPAPLLPLIYLGQWLHVGKETAFGLGRYRWLNA